MVGRNARWWALSGVSVAVLAAGLDGTVLSVALPTLASSLRATETDLQWFVTGYLLAMSAAMLPMGLIGDRYGRKRTLLGSLALFALGSVACAFAPSAGLFVAARAVLGIASAGLIVMALSALIVLFDEAERPRAVGVWAGANFLGLPIGPLLGGWLLTHAWWGWVFLMNVPVVAVAMILAGLLIPGSRAATRPGIDRAGIVLGSAGLVAVTYGLVNAGEHGWTSASTLAWLAAGAGVLLAFGAWEARLSRTPGGQPLVDVSLFTSRAFTWGTILSTVGVLAMFGVMFTMPQYFQGVSGLDAMGSGVRLVPLIGGLVLGAIPAERVARRAGARITVGLGFLVLGVSLLAGSATRLDSDQRFVALWMAGVGLGMGLALATAASGALAELSEERSGVGAAVMQSLQKLGGPFGAAVFGSILASVYRSSLPATGLPPAFRPVVEGSVFAGVAVAQRLHSAELLHSVRSAFVDGMDAALIVSASIAFAGMVLAVVFLPGRRAAAVLRPEEKVGAVA